MSKAEKILVVGGTGLVGNALVRAWLGRGTPIAGATFHRQPGAFFRHLDMRDPSEVGQLMDRIAPTLVAIPAANPHVDYCEQNPDETRRLNVEGTLTTAQAAHARGARVVFFSSDYVFDGRRESYKEEDSVHPLNEYGRQKAQVEEAVLRMDARNLVVRTSGAYGWQSEPKNFVLQVRARLGDKKPFESTSVRYNPTNADNLAEVVVRLTELGAAGIYHVTGGERVVRADFARLIAKVWGLDPGLIKNVAPSQLPPGSAPRPAESSLDTSKVRALAGLDLWTAEQGLVRMRDGEQEWRRQWKNLVSS